MNQAFLPFAFPSIDEEEIAAVVSVLRSGWVTTGQKAKQFEATLLPIVAQVRLVLTADEVVITTPGGKTEASTYQVEKIEGDAVTIGWTKEVKAGIPIHMTLTVAGDRATLVTSADPSKTTPLKRFAAAAAPPSPAAPATPAPAPAQP